MAASSMSDIKRRIKSVTSTEHITNAMKLVSAAKLRKAKSTLDKTNEYFEYVTASINDILHDSEEIPEQYLEGSREIVNTCFVIVTSGKGLCGAYNSNVIKLAEQEIEDDPQRSYIVAVGSKGRDYFQKRGKLIYSEYLEPPEDITFEDAQKLADQVIELYNSKTVDKVVLVYTHFKNNIEQVVQSVQLLPFKQEHKDGMGVPNEVEYEPSVAEVFNYLIPKYVELLLYGAIVESATCEHAARRMAMENATDAANEMLDSLSLYYNRARQAAITNEIIEVVSGSEAQK